MALVLRCMGLCASVDFENSSKCAQTDKCSAVGTLCGSRSLSLLFEKVQSSSTFHFNENALWFDATVVLA